MFLLKTPHSSNELFLRFAFYLNKYQEFSSREKYHASNLTRLPLPRVLKNQVHVTKTANQFFHIIFNQNRKQSSL